MTSQSMTEHTMQAATAWPCRLAAAMAVVIGLLLIAMGDGHLDAVMVEGRPLDVRYVSLVASGLALVVPGIVNAAVSPWIWRGRDWAFALGIISFVGLMAYLFWLHYMRATDPGVAANVGTELDVASAVVGLYIIVMTILWHLIRTQRE